MIEMRRGAPRFCEGLIAEEVSDLREEKMHHADRVLADEEIVAAVYEALAKRRPKSRSRGRLGAPAEVVLRLLVLKHIRNLSYVALEREVRANLVYRDFARVGGGKMPDAKTMGRWGLAVGPQVLKQIHDRIVKIAHEQGVVAGRRMRVDTTVVNASDPGAPLPWRHPRRGQGSERVRAIDRSYPQGQGRQAQRVRQDDQAARSRKPDHCRL